MKHQCFARGPPREDIWHLGIWREGLKEGGKEASFFLKKIDTDKQERGFHANAGKIHFMNSVMFLFDLFKILVLMSFRLISAANLGLLYPCCFNVLVLPSKKIPLSTYLTELWK